MAPINHHIEAFLGKLFSSSRNRDSGLLSRKSPAFSGRQPSITISSSDLGVTSPGTFTADKHEALGQNIFPELSWRFDGPMTERDNTRSWLLIVEDADVPLPSPIVHGLFYDIAREKMELHPHDFEVVEPDQGLLKGGFRYGKNRPGTVWLGPRPIINHGNHRYFITIVGLNTDRILGSDKSKTVTKEVLVEKLLQNRITCWGEYIGNFERKM